ncbi:MAG: gamma-glutamylcyclotransferase [Balneolaceae bacterium]|nr:MAG: gamma-glutamylcyclotransferase [Balneolaceae bacterium]
MKISYLFVYGTLRSDFPKKSPVKNILNLYAEWWCKATVKGKLHDIDWYPGLVPSHNPQDRVSGEIFRIMDEQSLLSGLDEYEGCSENYLEPHEYRREVIPVITEEGEIVLAWVYLYNWDVNDESQIHSGDYLNP